MKVKYKVFNRCAYEAYKSVSQWFDDEVNIIDDFVSEGVGEIVGTPDRKTFIILDEDTNEFKTVPISECKPFNDK